MDTSILALILAAFFISAFLKGITGLGFSTVCLGTLASFVDIKLAIPLVILPSLTSNVLVMLDSGRMREALRRFWPMYLCMMVGMAGGLWMLGATKSETARTVLGLVMCSYGAWALLNPGASIPERWRFALSLPVGLGTGFVNGLTGSQVMPALPYLMLIDIEKNLLIAAINISFTIGSLMMLTGLISMGLFTILSLWLAAAGIPLVFLGIWLGGIIRKHTSEAAFRLLVLLLLIGIGLNLVLRG
ncbi:MAG: sulfite exporter TauE/SafE family protein [Proteobacteria bacterium]|nr:sulfite exporter TauE/SafE family protein [Pseudomonadota bacterium]